MPPLPRKKGARKGAIIKLSNHIIITPAHLKNLRRAIRDDWSPETLDPHVPRGGPSKHAEVTALPECIAGLAERLGLQAELGLDDSAHHETTVAGAFAQNALHVLYFHGGPIIQAQEGRGQV